MRPSFTVVEIPKAELGNATPGVYLLTDNVKIFGELFRGRVQIEQNMEGTKRWLSLVDGEYTFGVAQTRTDTTIAWTTPADTESAVVSSEWVCLTPQAGQYLHWGGLTLPRRYVECNHRQVNRKGKYARLFAAIGTSVFDGGFVLDHLFQVPDSQNLPLRNTFTGIEDLNKRRGYGAATSAGITIHDTTLTIEQIPPHKHDAYPIYSRREGSSSDHKYYSLLSATSDTFGYGSTPVDNGRILGGGQPHNHIVSIDYNNYQALKVRILISF